MVAHIVTTITAAGLISQVNCARCGASTTSRNGPRRSLFPINPRSRGSPYTGLSELPNRILREGILTSERVDALSWPAEVFYRRLISVVDDFGRYSAKPALLRASCYPLRLDKAPESSISDWLKEVVEQKLVTVYEAGGKAYLEIDGFGQDRMRNRSSKYPSQDGVVVDRSNDGYVYLIGENYEKPVKVGYSLNPWARAKELSTGNHADISVLLHMRGSRDVEQEMHRVLAPVKKKNEWFELPADVAVVFKNVDEHVDATSLIEILRSVPSLLLAYGDVYGDGDVYEGGKKGDARKRATRLPADWGLPSEWKLLALKEQPTWNPAYCDKVAQTFRNYWVAKAGKDGTKLDWRATWHNWVIKEGPMDPRRAPKRSLGDALKDDDARN